MDARFGSYESNSLDIEEHIRIFGIDTGICSRCVHTHESTGVVQGGDISTVSGSITIEAKRDITSVGSRLSSATVIDLVGGRDILLDAQSVEVKNQ